MKSFEKFFTNHRPLTRGTSDKVNLNDHRPPGEGQMVVRAGESRQPDSRGDKSLIMAAVRCTLTYRTLKPPPGHQPLATGARREGAEAGQKTRTALHVNTKDTGPGQTEIYPLHHQAAT